MTADRAIEEAAAAIGAGEVVGVPTDTVYGLAVDPTRADATGRLFAVKRRPETFPLPVLVGTPEGADRLGVLDEHALRLTAAFWPGQLTVVVPRRPGVVLHLGGDESTVGLRCPDREMTRRLLRETGPLAVTSANVHGEAPATTAASLRAVLGDSVRVILDDGACDGMPSTVVSLASGRPRVLRRGAITSEEIEALLV